jgi:perosamine synthetase
MQVGEEWINKREDLMNKNIPLSVPNLDIEILEYIRETIETGWVSTGGRFITQFENDVMDYTRAGGARSVQSGTAGLHVALRVLGVQPEDEVIVPTLTFIASVNPLVYLGANPLFMDCDDTLNMDPNKLRKFLEQECVVRNGVTYRKGSDKPIKGIIVVHVFGNPAEMEQIMDIAKEYHLFVLEDAAEAFGSYYTSGRYKDRYCGTVGDIGVFSFNANKIITTGNGGMVVSENKGYLDEINYLSVQAKNDPLRYIHDAVGYNYRLTNISAAFGISQIRKLNSFIETKKRNYFKYAEEIKQIQGLRLLPFNENTAPNYWFYSLLIDPERYGKDREQLLAALLDRGIHTRPIWGLIHQQKPYRHHYAYSIERAHYYVDHVLNIPCSSNLSIEDVDFVIDSLRQLARI